MIYSKKFYLSNFAFILLIIIGAWQFTRVKNKLESDYRAYYMAGKKVISKITGLEFYVDKSLNKNGVVNKQTSFYDMSEATPFKYLPHTAILFAPFSLLPFFVAKKSWFLFTFGCLILSYALLRKSYLTKLDDKKRVLIELVSIFILYRFYQYDIRNLQINFPILLFLSFFIYLWKQKKETSAIFFLTLAVSIKIFPIIAFIPFLLKKKWKAITSALCFLIFFALIPILYNENLLTLYKNFFAFLNNGQHEYPASANYIFASIDSLIVRISMAKTFHNNLSLSLFDFSAGTTSLIINTVKIVFLSTASFLIYKKRTNLVTSVISLFSISLLLNPLAWKHAFVVLLPLIILILNDFNKITLKKTTIAFIILLSCSTKLFFGKFQPMIQAIGAIPISVVFLSFTLLFKGKCSISQKTVV